MADVACPLGECGYTGPMRSVEAHISGNTDDDHRGEVGRSHRENLRAQIEDRETSNDQQGSSGSPLVVADGGPEEQGETGTETTEAASEPDASEAGGIGLPFPALSTTQIVVVLVVVLVVASVLTSSAGGQQEPEQEEEETDQQADQSGGEVPIFE